jgi:hypothetical protein
MVSEKKMRERVGEKLCRGRKPMLAESVTAVRKNINGGSRIVRGPEMLVRGVFSR